MDTSIYNTGNTSLLQQFAVKNEKKTIVFGDRAITYNRCSGEKQDSVGWQTKITGAFVMQKGWNLIKTFGAKESAKTDDRVVFQEMLLFCKKENISHIVFYSYDRFSRAGNLGLIDELRNKGIKVHSATQLVDDETASGRMMQKFFLVLAEAENHQRREKVIEGLKNKLRKGEWIGEPPYGYEKRYVTGKKEHDHDKRQCFVNATGRTLAHAFYWKDNENLSDNQIVDRLKTMGLYLTPKKLRRIFRNPFYCGYITHSLLDEGEIIPGKQERLIDEATFLRINGILSRNPHGWKKTNRERQMPLKFIVRCGICDLPLTGYVKKDIYVYYKCRNKGCCVNVAGKELHQLFKNELSKYAISEQFIPFVKSQLESTYLFLHQSEVVREKPMKDELARLRSELNTMEYNLSIDKLPLHLYQKHSALHSERIHAIETELKILGKDTSNLGVYIDKTLQNIRNLTEMWEKLDLTGKIRLQKLVFPVGLRYMPENGTLRTLEVNPIFSVIASISNNLMLKSITTMTPEIEKVHQVYSGFPSSNFFWENLEKTAVELKDMWTQQQLIQKPVYSMTGCTPTFSTTSTTTANSFNPSVSALVQSVHTLYTGTTDQHLFG